MGSFTVIILDNCIQKAERHLQQAQIHLIIQSSDQKVYIEYRRMNSKKQTCKFEDYIQPTSQLYNSCNLNMTKSAADFKLDRIFPRNINIKLYLDNKQNTSSSPKTGPYKNSQYQRGSPASENRFFNEYMNMKEQQIQNNIKRNKINQIFNIRSINLVQKFKQEQECTESSIKKVQQKHLSIDNKRNKTQKLQKDAFKGLNLIIMDKVKTSPENYVQKMFTDKRSSTSFQKFIENKPFSTQKNGESFESKLGQYLQFIRENCEAHGLGFKQIQNYPRNSVTFSVGKGNNGYLIKEMLKKRWWWSLTEDKLKKNPNFIWTQLKQKSFYSKKPSQKLSLDETSSRSESFSASQKRPETNQTHSSEMGFHIHNHFQNNEFLGNKKALYYNMKAYYESKGKNVFDYLPVTFHVKRYDDDSWKQFTKYYFEDVSKHEGQRRLWIVKPGENSNRGNGITIHSEYQKVRELIQRQISESNSKKTFIIQKYIDKPWLYNRRKFDIRCYMLLVRLNGFIKGYWYNQGYIRTSCYEYQLDDTYNEYIHLTNDAIQVHCDKYGKYEDGNKLSYANFQKYLDQQHKGNYQFIKEICPQLKQIATDSIEATYHLLGEWKNLPTFQIFGLDYMIDQNFKPWLIEINTNPCLETSSTTLQRVIPRMVDHAFKLSLDLICPPPLNWTNSKKHYLPTKGGHSLFELIFDESNKTPSTSEGNRKDQIIIQMGQIEEDNEVFQDQKDPMTKKSKMPEPSLVQ